MNKNKTQNQSVVPDGYKRTEVGIIPENWDEVRVGDIAKVKGGKRLPSGFALVDTPTPHPYVRVKDMYPGGVNQSEIKYVPEQAFPAIQNYRIYSEDVFISVAGSLGVVGVVPSQLSGANLTENANYITEIKCDRDYLKYYLMSESIQKVIKLIQTTGAQPKLALGRIAKFIISIPQDIKEQRAIAKALSDVDGLLNALEALIAKKRAIKQATMQQLLTGKTRLPGFRAEWETVKMGQIGSIYGGLSGKNKNDFEGGNARYVTFLGVLENVTLDMRHTERVRVRQGESQNSVMKGDLLFNASSETPSDLAIGAVMGEQLENLYLNSFCFGFRIHDKNKYMPLFFAYYFRGSVGRAIMNALAQGATRYNMSKSQFLALELSIPSGEEQHAIATVLSDMDAEIAALEQRRDKTRAIKQGMMQQLLTGRVRLVKSEVTSYGEEN